MSRLKVLLILLLFFGISVYVNFKSSNIPDPDSLYHIRHSWIYRTSGIFDPSFPWTQFSAIRTAGADLWYGFHMILIPFTFTENLTASIKWASVLITFFIAISLFVALKNLNIKFPELWTAFLLFSSPAIITRITMARPHPISLGLTALIFSFFYRGSAIWVFIFSFLLSWIHASVFWFPMLAVGSLVFFQKLNGQAASLRKITAFSAGIVAGLLARPHSLANLKLIYIQVVDLYFSKSNKLAKVIGGELRPPTLSGLYDQKWLFIALAISLVYFLWHIYRKKKIDADKKVILSSFLVMIGLSALMYSMARRAIDQLGLFIAFFTGSVSYLFLRGRFVKVFLFSLIIGLSAYNLVNADFNQSHSPVKFKESALWLGENTKKEETVFYLNWGYFPFLFFWNQSNYYINGMDPVFLLKYDEKLYWKLYNMAVNENDKKLYWKLNNAPASDMGGITCGYDPRRCGPENIEAVPDVLRNDFHASYIFVTKANKAGFSEYLKSDKNNFKKVYENEKEETTIFKVL